MDNKNIIHQQYAKINYTTIHKNTRIQRIKLRVLRIQNTYIYIYFVKKKQYITKREQ